MSGRARERLRAGSGRGLTVRGVDALTAAELRTGSCVGAGVQTGGASTDTAEVGSWWVKLWRTSARASSVRLRLKRGDLLAQQTQLLMQVVGFGRYLRV
jgi:hypothetical protein